MEKKEIPSIEIVDNVLVIKISASDLKWVAEHKPDADYAVTDDAQFLNNFAANLEDYGDHNDREKGQTALQSLIDKIIDETYENGSEAIIDKNEKL